MVSVHDPYVAEYPGVPIVSFVEEAVKGADAIVIFAGHHQYRGLDPKVLKNLSGKKHPVIVDGRNMMDPDVYIRRRVCVQGDRARGQERACDCGISNDPFCGLMPPVLTFSESGFHWQLVNTHLSRTPAIR